MIEDDGWTDDGNITFTVYADTGNGPGGVVATHTGEFTKMDTGDVYFGRDDFDYWIEGIDIALGAGTYWMGIRNDGGGGAGRARGGGSPGYLSTPIDPRRRDG